MQTLTPLTDQNLMRLAPSIFADNPFHEVSSRYTFIPTIQVVNLLRQEGWFPTQARESQVRLEDKQGFQKHIIRFNRENDIQKIQEETPQIVLVNSHDRSCAYQFSAGFFRLICMNGLIVASAAQQFKTRHLNWEPEKIIETSYEILESTPLTLETINSAKQISLTPPERKAFAEASTLLLYDNISDSPFSPNKLLIPHRYSDKQNEMSLWNTFNIVQENILKGGVRGIVKNKDGHRRNYTSRKVKSIDRDVKLNRALWHLMTSLLEYKN